MHQNLFITSNIQKVTNMIGTSTFQIVSITMTSHCLDAKYGATDSRHCSFMIFVLIKLNKFIIKLIWRW